MKTTLARTHQVSFNIAKMWKQKFKCQFIHWLVDDSFGSYYRLRIKTFKNVIDWSMTVLDCITALESQIIQKCHWLVNDSFGLYYSPGIAENWKVSLTGQWQFRIVLQPRSRRKFKSVIDQLMTILDRITAQESQKIQKRHWPVNDSFGSYYSPGIAENW